MLVHKDREARPCGAGRRRRCQPVEHRLQKEFTGLDGVTWESACRHQTNPCLHRVRDSLMMANSASSFEEDQQKQPMTLSLMSLHKSLRLKNDGESNRLFRGRKTGKTNKPTALLRWFH